MNAEREGFFRGLIRNSRLRQELHHKGLLPQELALQGWSRTFLVVWGKLALVSAQSGGLASLSNSSKATDEDEDLAFSGDLDPRPLGASYSRYSSDNQSESSIVDQRRICCEKAASGNFRIPSGFEFAGGAVSGTKRQRDGLDRLLEAAKRRAFQVVYFHSLSRLARESVISMPILKTLVHTYGIRFISVSEGVDSAQLGWETITTVLCLHHEMFIRDLSANVVTGQAELDQFVQAYAVEKTRIEARRRGHSVTEQTLTDGSIKLTVQVGGAA